MIRIGWPKMTAARISQAVGLIMLLSGFAFLLASAPYDSYVAAFVGLGLTLWGALLLLIMPTKYVKLELLTAASSSLAKNFEEMLDITTFNRKAVYLPSKLLKDHQSSLIFIPANGTETLPKQKDIPEGSAQRTSKGLFLTPPGLALSKLFEKQMGKSFTEINLNQLAKELPSLLDELGITKTALINVEGGKARALVTRLSTERPEAVKAGFAEVVGTEKKAIIEAMKRTQTSNKKLPKMSPYGDGNAGREISTIVVERISAKSWPTIT